MIRAGWLCALVVLTAVALVGDARAATRQEIDSRIASHPKETRLTPEQQPGNLVTIKKGKDEIVAQLYLPEGEGPFPAILWNHGSEKLPGEQPELANFYVKQGFAFLLPYRTGQGRTPGTYIEDEMKKARANAHTAAAANSQVVAVHERANADVVAAVQWLKTQQNIDPARIVVSGVSYGGIQTLLTAEKDLGVSAYIAFAPAAMSWGNTQLQARLSKAVAGAKAPLFLIQAKNDYSTGPYTKLGPEITKRGAPSRAKLYPDFGKTQAQGHYAFATWDAGTMVWGADVIAFIKAAWEKKAG
jgi:carboxymethylenebutenolidase